MYLTFTKDTYYDLTHSTYIRFGRLLEENFCSVLKLNTPTVLQQLVGSGLEHLTSKLLMVSGGPCGVLVCMLGREGGGAEEGRELYRGA